MREATKEDLARIRAAHAGCLARTVRELLDKISGDGGGER